MKIKTALAVAGLACATAAWGAPPLACAAAEKQIAEFLENLEAKDGADLQACTASHGFCLLADQGVVAAAARAELKGKGAAATAALIQFNEGRQGICLGAVNAGGSGWVFDGWQMDGDKLVQLRRFAYSRIEANKVTAEELAAAMQKAYAKNVKGAP